MINEKNYTSESKYEDVTKYESDIPSEYSSEMEIKEEPYEDKYVKAKPYRLIIKARLIND